MQSIKYRRRLFKITRHLPKNHGKSAGIHDLVLHPLSRIQFGYGIPAAVFQPVNQCLKTAVIQPPDIGHQLLGNLGITQNPLIPLHNLLSTDPINSIRMMLPEQSKRTLSSIQIPLMIKNTGGKKTVRPAYGYCAVIPKNGSQFTIFLRLRNHPAERRIIPAFTERHPVAVFVKRPDFIAHKGVLFKKDTLQGHPYRAYKLFKLSLMFIRPSTSPQRRDKIIHLGIKHVRLIHAHQHKKGLIPAQLRHGLRCHIIPFFHFKPFPRPILAASPCFILFPQQINRLLGIHIHTPPRILFSPFQKLCCLVNRQFRLLYSPF